MVNEQMGAPAAAMSPEDMAIYEQMRQQISPQEFSNEMLAGASQIDPQAVAEFTQELQGLDMPPEVLDELNDMVDDILANPDQYDEIRGDYIASGVPEDLLPEQFDPQFFAALNMAIDQMIAAPTGVQAFAKGGIAELKPIAKAIASYGRDGDTMLAHITPAEARMLRRRGGAGTINPDTGLPEFRLRRALKKLGNAITKPLRSVAKAVKKFAQSKIGRLVATVALGFFVGPAAASMLGVGSVAGVAAVSGFVGSAGSTLLAGGNLKDALKAGAIGGVTAGAGAGLMGGAGAFQAGSYTGPTTVSGQFARFKDAVGFGPTAPPGGAPVVDAPAAVPGAGATPSAPGIEAAGAAPMASAAPGAAQNLAPMETMVGTPNPNFTNPPPPQGSSMFDSVKRLYNENISPSGIRAQALPGAQEAGSDAVSALLKRVPSATPAMQEAAYQTAMKSALPGTLATYGPMAAAGLGAMALTGGFETKQPELSPTAQGILDRDKGRPTISDRPDLFYIQNMPGVKYDEKGNIIGSQPWSPSVSMDEIRVPANQGGIGSLAPPPMYNPQMGSMGSGQMISQPYNTSSMYTNLMQPPRFAEGGEVEDPDYMMQGGIPHLFSGGLLRRIRPAAQQATAAAQAALAQRTSQGQSSMGGMKGFLRRAGQAVQQGLSPIAGIRDQREQQQIAAQQAAAAQLTAEQRAAAEQAAAQAAAEQARQRVLADRQGRAAQFAQSMQFNPGMGQAPGGMGMNRAFADGGIAGLAQGGYPRRTGQISGPGTEKSDSIPAMLSDGEFVMTAKAVRGAGKGSRRAGAKKMYELMHQLERNASRG
jgi:hypothetical protein